MSLVSSNTDLDKILDFQNPEEGGSNLLRNVWVYVFIYSHISELILMSEYACCPQPNK
jgi:hypothetical protein